MRQEFPRLSLPDVPIDLMYLLRRVGLDGRSKGGRAGVGLNLRANIADVGGSAVVVSCGRYLEI